MPPYVSLLAMIRIWSTFGVARAAYCCTIACAACGTVTPRALMFVQPPPNRSCSGVVRGSRTSGSQSMPD